MCCTHPVESSHKGEEARERQRNHSVFFIFLLEKKNVKENENSFGAYSIFLNWAIGGR